MLVSYRESGVNALPVVIALDYFTIVCNVISVLVEMQSLAMVNFDIFLKYKMIAV